MAIFSNQHSFPRIVRFFWLILAGLALVIQISYVPASLDNRFSDPRVLNSYSALKTIFPFQYYAFYVLALRYLVVIIFWSVAIFLFSQTSWTKGKFTWIGLFTSLLLLLLPRLLILDNVGEGINLPPPWGPVLDTADLILTALTLAMFVLYYYIFPDGSFAPVWLRWLGLFFGVGISSLLYLLWSEKLQDEWIWVATMLSLLIAILVGIASQIYRFLHLPSPEQKRQTIWMVFTLILQPFGILAGDLGRSALTDLLSMHLRIIVAAMLPIVLFASLLDRRLWDFEFPRRKIRFVAVSVSVMVLTFVGILGLLSKVNQDATAPAISFEPIPQTGNPRPVVIDTDMAPDDWLAIIYLLQRPDIQVLAITVTGTGETHCPPGIQNALGLVALAGESGIPVACGREIPLEGDHVFPPAWREQADGLVGLQLPEGINPPAPRAAADLLISTIETSPKKVALLTLGPLTNLGEAIEQDDSFLGNIEQIFIMGGAMEVLGNVGFSGVEIDNQVAEWNIFIDPLATQIVLASGAPVTLVPLDATNHVPVTLDFYFKLGANRRTPEADFAYEVLTNLLGELGTGYSSFWDPLTAALLVDESLGYIKRGNIWVSTDPGTTSGLTRVLDRGYPARYAKSADAPRFEYEFLRTLNQP